jgi:hypothetical protein
LLFLRDLHQRAFLFTAPLRVVSGRLVQGVLRRLVLRLELIQLLALAGHQGFLFVKLLTQGAELQLVRRVIVLDLGFGAALFIFLNLDERLFLLDHIADLF